MSEISTKPYLIRALHEWCTDNGYTPHIAVTVDERVVVPREHVTNGEIVLNVGRLATHKLQLGNEFIEFQARFGGVARQISVPMDAVTAIYARETGHGMAFEAGPPALSDAGVAPDSPVVDDAATVEPQENVSAIRPQLSAVPAGDAPAVDGKPDDTDPAPPGGPDRGRPKLTIIK
ncbi:ClpXP protease specificity-enhancing factor [Pigmentiphaga sp.]|uniref:ClpXP protease specificity-enhancing factor n=1 Tax=Pigmentiphaga sp. TaxID=1977564 RepID=UPI00128D53C1|nr:ClpXP protease specificity-enhancing factor [Pigmentiphaga sp.]MPS25299.1 ClpXP protease specificity-enhancing factor [Alcaligenaceae bacterium SAGV5]MPS53892.1 ClpXP protease specificity-enhancing factor [Alcaligenaceae bacterium SAGV3]MPT59114.1 ClpXP protease specificity-enhancing factor [Alcaligenaceae bacterium]